MRRLIVHSVAAVCAALGAVAACDSRSDTPAEEVGARGTLTLDLEAVSASGKVYRLRQAVFPVSPSGFIGSVDAGVGAGGGSSTGGVVLSSETDPTRPVIEAFLQPNGYLIELLDGWFIEQVDDLLGTRAPVDAVLTSSNVQFFQIESNEEAFVKFDFEVDGERVVFGPPGRLIVGIGVRERGGGGPPGLNPRRSLLETNVDTVASFSLEQVLLATQVNSGLTPDPVLLYQQIIDSYASPSTARLPDAVHCGDETTDGIPTLNGYPIRCDRLERLQFDNIDQWFATAAVNRLDLAPADGSHCGQQRLIFANNAPIGNGRMFIIIEAQVPNPHPECGIDACRPLGDFWAAESDIDDPEVRSNRLLEAFLFGSPELSAAGFGPFLTVENLSVGTGNVRTNNFNDNIWTLREFKLLSDELGQSRAVPFPVGESPHGALWDDTSSLAQGDRCRQSLLDAVDGLLSDDPAEMAVLVDHECLNSESPNDFLSENYPFHLASGSGAFREALADRLSGTGLTPEDIAARAQFAGSCMGCHLEGNGLELGRGVFSPFSNGFVHVDEFFVENCGDGTSCFGASQALTDVFLPRRLRALTELLDRPGACGVAPDGGSSPPPDVDGGSAPPPPDGGGEAAVPAPGERPPSTVLEPDETIDDLVSEDDEVRDSLSGETLGGEPAGVSH